MLYTRILTLRRAGVIDMFFPGHVPGKNTMTREPHRNAAAKPARRPEPNCRRESSEAIP